MRSDVPPRPSIPPSVWVAVAVGFGIAGAERLNANLITVLGLAVLGACVCALAFARGSLGIAVVTAGFIAGFLAGALYWMRWQADVRGVEVGSYGRISAEVIADPLDGKFGTSTAARIVGGGPSGARIRVALPRDCPRVELGQVIEFWGRVKPPGQDARGAQARQSGQVGSVSARRVRVVGWARGVTSLATRFRAQSVRRVDAIAGPGGDLLAGVMLGDRRRLQGNPISQAFAACGLTHLVAVSGGHLAVTAGLAAAILGGLGARRAVRYSGTTLVAVAYVVFTGMQSSAIRAAAMSAIAGAALFGGRRADPASALSAAAVLMMLLWPPTVFDLGFRLSCAAVAGLVLLAGLVRAWVRAGIPLPRVAGDAIALTLVAQAVTAPITTPVFGTLSLIAPLANAVTAPLVELGLAAGLAGLCVMPIEPLSTAVLRLAAMPLALSARLAEWMAGVPGAYVPADSTVVAVSFALPVLLAALWLLWPRPRPVAARGMALGCVALVAVLAAGPVAPHSAEVVALDVGQGDAILVRDGSNAILVDAGPSGSVLRSALARHGVRKLDAVIVTHLHEDHIGGLEGLAGLIPVGKLYGARGAGERLEELARRGRIPSTAELGAGERLSVGAIQLDVVSPEAAVTDAAENRSSVVLVARVGDGSVLLTGDAESDVLDVLASRGMLPDVDVVKVGHHGSVGALDEVDLAALRPESAVISVGTGNKFGHPRPQTLSLLATHRIPVRRTDEDGDIAILGAGAMRQ